ncbi:MAG TPA: Calx-beta domain-containing protein [Baekduia sp.]|nr:Calx-beta domain-containing protein [Baekduia sp.]
MRRSLTLTLAAAASAAVLVPAAAQADGTKRTAAGSDPASVQAAIDAFRVDLGGNNNGGGPPAASGRREVNWDGVPDTAADPNPFPGGFFLGRGLQLDTAGTGFKVSAKAASGTPVRFNNPEFKAFSEERLFSPIGSTTYDSHFFVPGTATPATTNGFGAVFTDVDTTGSAKIEYFDAAGALIDTIVVPASPNGGLSFAGESFNAGERVARVRVTSGTTTTLTADGGQDAVVQDDFLYGEPLPGQIALQSADESVEEDAGKAILTVTRQGANSGTATVAYATADGSAKAGKDYTAKSGTVTFGPGETTKRIEIAVSADKVKEGDETYSVALSNASGAALGAPRTATVTIHDRTKRLKATLHRLIGLKYVLAANANGTYRIKLTLTTGQAKKLGLKKRTLISTGNRTLREGGNTLTLKLGNGTKAKLHAAKVRPTLAIALSDGSTLRTRVVI